jgi:hypothetical protein
MYNYAQTRANSESLFLCFSSSLNKLNFILVSCTKAIKSCNTKIIIIQTIVLPTISSPPYYVLMTLIQAVCNTPCYSSPNYFLITFIIGVIMRQALGLIKL